MGSDRFFLFEIALALLGGSVRFEIVTCFAWSIWLLGTSHSSFVIRKSTSDSRLPSFDRDPSEIPRDPKISRSQDPNPNVFHPDRTGGTEILKSRISGRHFALLYIHFLAPFAPFSSIHYPYPNPTPPARIMHTYVRSPHAVVQFA